MRVASGVAMGVSLFQNTVAAPFTRKGPSHTFRAASWTAKLADKERAVTRRARPQLRRQPGARRYRDGNRHHRSSIRISEHSRQLGEAHVSQPCRMKVRGL